MNSHKHPCFNASAKGQWGRIHLPIAPDCNMVCAYCDRKTDCVNESRPGVCSRVLDPEEAAERVDRAVRRMPSLGVVGIAGPGDPLANPAQTLRTLELVRRRQPGLLLCLSTNGLVLADYACELKRLGVEHITITVNAISSGVVERVYRGVWDNGRFLRGTEAAQMLLARQELALEALKLHDFTVKVNTVVIPGINDHEVEKIARHVSRFKVKLMNCIGLIPVPGTLMGAVPPPSAKRMEELRKLTGVHVAQMRHCARCRSDAFGLLGQDAGLQSLRNRSRYASTRSSTCYEPTG